MRLLQQALKFLPTRDIHSQLRSNPILPKVQSQALFYLQQQHQQVAQTERSDHVHAHRPIRSTLSLIGVLVPSPELYWPGCRPADF